MLDFINSVKSKAKTLNKKIVFPETDDNRTLEAIKVILEEETAVPILLGKADEIQKQADGLGLQINWDRAQFMDMEDPALVEKYATALYEKRKKKGLTLDKAKELIKNRDYFGTMVVELDNADGMISGATGPTSGTLLPALQIIKTKEKFHKVSGFFFMILDKRLLLFADCAVTINPNSFALADIAIDTAETALRFDIEPRIAMLSFSTNRSADHPMVDKVREATAIVKDKRPNLIIDGEMQVDTAVVPEIAKRKFPKSKIQGDANILIFPDVQCGNIAYKLVERLGGAKAVGPILQGLNKPINDLSRGCSSADIVNLAAFTACEAQEMIYK